MKNFGSPNYSANETVTKTVGQLSPGFSTVVILISLLVSVWKKRQISRSALNQMISMVTSVNWVSYFWFDAQWKKHFIFVCNNWNGNIWIQFVIAHVCTTKFRHKAWNKNILYSYKNNICGKNWVRNTLIRQHKICLHVCFEAAKTFLTLRSCVMNKNSLFLSNLNYLDLKILFHWKRKRRQDAIILFDRYFYSFSKRKDMEKSEKDVLKLGQRWV